MNISKYILLISLILLPVLSYAQRIGNKYIVTTGDTTRVVNAVSGLNDPSSMFLVKKNTAASDSVLANLSSDYSSLEEALMDVNTLITNVEKDQAHLKTGNESLGYRLSKINLEGLQKDKQAKAMADSVLREMHLQSVEEMARKYEKFGNKPTYFINGINVRPETINEIMPGDIVERNLKIQDTSSGNPNGEIWFVVTDKAARRMGLLEADAQTAGGDYSTPALPSVDAKYNKPDNTKNVRGFRSDSKSKEVKSPAERRISKTDQKSKNSKRSVRQIKADREARDNGSKGGDEDVVVNSLYETTEEFVPAAEAVSSQIKVDSKKPKNRPVQTKQPDKVEPEVKADAPKDAPASTVAPAQKDRKTYVRARTVNNEEVKTSDPIDSAEEPLN